MFVPDGVIVGTVVPDIVEDDDCVTDLVVVQVGTDVADAVNVGRVVTVVVGVHVRLGSCVPESVCVRDRLGVDTQVAVAVPECVVVIDI